MTIASVQGRYMYIWLNRPLALLSKLQVGGPQLCLSDDEVQGEDDVDPECCFFFPLKMHRATLVKAPTAVAMGTKSSCSSAASSMISPEASMIVRSSSTPVKSFSKVDKQ